MCQLAGISRAGLYRFRPASLASKPDLALRDAIQRVALEFPSYGWRRITAELHRRHGAVNHKRVYRWMRADNLLCLRKRKFVVTTNSDHGRCAARFLMSFLRHQEIYPFDEGAILQDHALPHRTDEFPAGYSLAGCAPAEPASASPAACHLAAPAPRCTIEFQRTAGSVLTACLSPGDHPTLILKDILASVDESNPFSLALGPRDGHPQVGERRFGTWVRRSGTRVTRAFLRLGSSLTHWVACVKRCL